MRGGESVRADYLSMIQRDKNYVIAKETAYNEETIRFLWRELDRLEDKIIEAKDGYEAISLFWNMYFGEFRIRVAGLFNRHLSDADFAEAKKKWHAIHGPLDDGIYNEDGMLIGEIHPDD